MRGRIRDNITAGGSQLGLNDNAWSPRVDIKQIRAWPHPFSRMVNRLVGIRKWMEMGILRGLALP